MFRSVDRPVRKLARRLGTVLLVTAALVLGACGSDAPEPYVERPVDDLYNGALNLLIAGDYEAAASEFDEVERQHPYSEWATRAQLMSAFAYYQNDAYDDAILAADRFIQLHPGHKDVAYAYYLIGQCYYEQISSVSQDQRMTELARQAFTEVIRLFPNSEYGRDAQLKFELTDDHLAGKEMSIGRWYQQRNEWVAAINRFRNVVEQYQTTSQVPEALLRLTETYLALGVVSEAQTAAAVLGHNFPGSQWYEDSYNLLAQHNLVPQLNEDSWISEATGNSG
jgi:outer membrane protein assembly factor BamD